MTSSGCQGILTQEAFDLFREVLQWFYVLAPICLLVLVATDFGKAVLSQDDGEIKKVTSKVTKRIIATFLVFLVPFLVNLLLGMPAVQENLGDVGLVDDSSCYGETRYSVVVRKSTESGTSQPVDMVLTPSFDYAEVKLPNGTVVKNGEEIKYTATQNGTYIYTFYDEKGEEITQIRYLVGNIDTAPPEGSCIYEKDTITVSAKDESGILGYSYYNGSSYTSFIANHSSRVGKKIETPKVKVKDKVGNVKELICTVEKGTDPIVPTSNVVYKATSDSLQVHIQKNSRKSRTGYYTTYIWAENPYEQFKSNVPNRFGKELVRPKTLLDNAISKNSLSGKIAVAVNASGFVKNGTWGQKYYNANSGWNLTSGSPIVIVDGKVLRDFASKKVPSGPYVTYGMKKDGMLAYYNYVGGTKSQTNINTSNKIISDGVLHTFAFSPVLVYDGVLKSKATDKNIRQGLCQIDENNFVFITDVYRSSRNGFSFKELGNYMISIGCKIGFNLDGGGSVALIFKEQNKGSVVVTGNSRSVADIVYFREL